MIHHCWMNFVATSNRQPQELGLDAIKPLPLFIEKTMFSLAIHDTHLFVRKAELRRSISEYKQQYTVFPKYDNLKPVRLYRETETLFGFPRYTQVQAERTRDLRTTHPVNGYVCKATMRPEQQRIEAQFLKSISNGRTGFLINMRTGSGKTVVALRLLEHLKQRALVIVPRDFIVEQWIDRILQHTNLKRGDIGIARQAQCEYADKAITIGMIQSLYKDKYPAAFKQAFGCVIIDECHLVGAAEFSKVVQMFPARYRIGMTATLKRQDGMEKVYEVCVGEIVLKALAQQVKPIIVRRPYMTRDKIPDYVFRIRDKVRQRGAIISCLARDYARNTLVAVQAQQLTKTGRQVLILGERKKQLFEIYDILNKRYGFSRDSLGVFIQETPQSKRRWMLDNCKIVLATTQIMGMAVDAPTLAALIFATPLSQTEQAIGRILRLLDGKKTPVVLDIVDMLFPAAIRWAKNREYFYRQQGWEIRRIATSGTR